MTGTVLVTGGTGTLGSVVVQCLLDRGRNVRLLSRRQRPAAHGHGRWFTGDLRSGDGIEQAVGGVDTIVHCATGGRGDLAATRRLVDHAKTAGATHLVYISIVGIEQIPMFYYRAKLQAERLISGSGLGWSILRATQFHDLVAAMVSAQRYFPAVVMPAGIRFQPVDVRDVAARLVDLVEHEPQGRVPDFGGPQILAGDHLARAWLNTHGMRRPVVRPRLPGKIVRGVRRGSQPHTGARRGRAHLRRLSRRSGGVTMRAPSWLRAGLVFLAATQGVVGGWALLFPRVFFDIPWVGMRMAYNEHLMMDYGAMSLAAAVLLGVAATTMDQLLARTALLSYLTWATLHLVIHLRFLDMLTAVEGTTLMIALAAAVLLTITLFALTRKPRPVGRANSTSAGADNV